MSRRLVLASLAACLIPGAALAGESVSLRTAGADCIGVVTDLLPSVRKSGQIRVDGDAILQRDAGNRFRVDRDVLLQQCGEDRKVVEIRVDRA
jgi:hypothetical protein